jgi:two-component system sensor kinase FixL
MKAESKSQPQSPSSSASTETILLVDDNPVNLQILQNALAHGGQRLLTAVNGEQALELARQEQPTLILLDILMPGMDGFEVCEILKQDPQTQQIAIIFLSALDDIDAKIRGFSVGGVDYIAKPFQLAEVLARVKTHLRLRHLERALQRRNFELEAENQQILNVVSEGIIGLDENLLVTTLNPSATQLTGWAEVDALGSHLTELRMFDVDAGGRNEQYLLKAIRHGRPYRSEMEWVRTRKGEWMPVAFSCTSRPDGGRVLVLHDVSDRMKSEEALRVAREELESQRQHLAHIERLNTMGEMAAGVAHEVNQPLTAITNYARVAKRLLDSPAIDRLKLTELLEKLDLQAVRAAEVVQRLRSYVRKPDGLRQPIDLNQLLSDVIALAEVDARINDVPVHFESRFSTLPVDVDVVQIQQVALNLIRNAMESMAETSHKGDGVTVRTVMQNEKCGFEVIDRGKGITADDKQHLFEPFFTTKANGMGIGLSVCQSIMQGHSGEINCRSELGVGTTFYCILPVAEAA